MQLEMFNEIYFFYIACFLLFLGLSMWLLKGKSDVFKTRYIASLLFFALLVHFCKLLFPPYIDDEMAIRKITPENICALSTLIFPFIFLSKNKVLKDYMFYIGVLSGTLAVIFPAEAFGKSPFIFDTIRFYVAHIIITCAPFLMVSTGLHKLDYHRIYKVPIMFIIVLAIIMVNEIILIEIGIVQMRSGDLLDPEAYRNFSMIFGVREDFMALEGFLTFFTPRFMTEIPYGAFAGEPKYWPILWIIGPTFAIIGSLSFVLSIYWEHRHMKEDLSKIKLYLIKSFKMIKKT